jgi:hypothetical protein
MYHACHLENPVNGSGQEIELPARLGRYQRHSPPEYSQHLVAISLTLEL